MTLFVGIILAKTNVFFVLFALCEWGAAILSIWCIWYLMICYK